MVFANKGGKSFKINTLNIGIIVINTLTNRSSASDIVVFVLQTEKGTNSSSYYIFYLGYSRDVHCVSPPVLQELHLIQSYHFYCSS